ncbi:MAG: hypothetical protein LBP68_06660, partial [Acidobacteriota bacterium]|nr:hypothetical protein [Acidobacteriota bacterium]
MNSRCACVVVAIAIFFAVGCLFGTATFAQEPPSGTLPTAAEAAHRKPEQIRSVDIPKVSRAPKFEDFINGVPREAEAVITDFRQIDPGDGDPVSQPTTAYLSYDDKNIYAAFICKDDPTKIRAQIARRDS